MHTFTNWGKNMHLPPFLHPLAIILQTCYLAIYLPPPPGGGGSNRKIYTPDIKFENIHSKLRLIGRHLLIGNWNTEFIRPCFFFKTSHNSSNICNFSYLRLWNYRITKRRLCTDFFSLKNSIQIVLNP